ERRGRTERCHHGVPGEFLDGPADAVDLPGHGLVEAVEQRPGPLRVLRAAELGRADEVGEDHGGEFPFALIRLRLLRRPTCRTEACGFRKRDAAGSTCAHRGY